ncbi:MAG: L-threonylcarbamoyladenylate synthase [Thermofilum sp.]
MRTRAMRTVVYKVDPEHPDPEVIRASAQVLRGGGLVAFPTETVYGLGALASDPRAVLRVFEVKRRPPDNPLILHICEVDQLFELASRVPEDALKLAEKFWPGPLTLVLSKSPRVIKEVTGGLEKVAVRMPAHPVALALVKEVGEPIAAPSANISGRPSPTEAQHVIEDLYGLVEVIIDAGETVHGLESTIIDMTTDPPTLLRPGALPVDAVEAALGRRVAIPGFARGLGEAEAALAPGTKYRHYAPRAPMVVVESSDYGDLSRVVAAVSELAREKMAEGLRVCILCTEETKPAYSGLQAITLCLGSRGEVFSIARRLFKVLREADATGCEFIVAEGLEERGLGLAIMNRLRKASGFRIVRI